MKLFSIVISVSLISTVWFRTAAAEDASPPDRYAIDVITVDPGPELFTRWGHISIMVTDRVNQDRKAYNFGTFDFEDPALRFRYARGYLNYWLDTVPYGLMIRYYESQKRGIINRTLDLTPEQAAAVAERLAENALPKNRTYAYRHYLDNCCTRIRDLLDDVLGGELRQQFEAISNDRTYRYYTERALKGLPVMRNVILFIMGRGIDRPINRWEEQFLPEVFGDDLDKMTIGPEKRPLVAERRVLYEQTGTPAGERAALWETLTAASVLGALFLGMGLPLLFPKKKWAPRAAGAGLFLWGLLAGLGGLLIALLWTATAHYDCHNNENILVFPATHLWLTGPGLMLMIKNRLGSKTNRWARRYLLGTLILLGINLVLKLGPFFQENYQFILFAGIMNTAGFFILRFMDTHAPETRR